MAENTNGGKKWTNAGAGPIQCSEFNKALRALLFLKGAQVELRGVHGRPATEKRFGGIIMVGSSGFVLPAQRHAEIGERFGWTLTKGNAKDATAAYEAATKECNNQDLWPIEDNRISAEEADKRDAAAKVANERDEKRHAEARQQWAAIESKRPAWAEAVIIAELHESTCDPMSDYFGSKVVRTCAIGWRRGSREDFKQLRRAAGAFEPTAEYGLDKSPCTLEGLYLDTDANKRANKYGMRYPAHFMPDELRDPKTGDALDFDTIDDARRALELAGFIKTRDAAKYEPEVWAAPASLFCTGQHGPEAWAVRIAVREIEHRDNYSMGEGNWVGTDRYHGWQIKSRSTKWDGWSALEDCIPEPSQQQDTPGEPTHGEGFTITDRTHTKRGTNYSQVELSDRVDRERFNALRDSCKRAGGWYSREWSGIPGGFAFDSRDKAENWARETFKPEPVRADDCGTGPYVSAAAGEPIDC